MSADETIPPEPPSNFVADFGIRDTTPRGDYWEQWGKPSDTGAGISGLWFPFENLMVVDRRTLAHHNQQYSYIHEELGALSPVMPWAAGFNGAYDDGEYIGTRAVLELPSSAGGLFQYLTRNNLRDEVDAWQHGHDVAPDHLWPVVYTARLLDMPSETTVRFDHEQQRMRSVEETYPVSREFKLEMAYMELQWLPGGLPEPKIERDVEVLDHE